MTVDSTSNPVSVSAADGQDGKTRQHRHRTKRGAGLPSIGDRLDEVNDRSVPGHWEADHIIGAHNRSAMLWLTERVTRYGIGVTMPEGYSANAVLAGLVEACDQIPTHLLRSITFDQGGEWAEWETLANEYKIDAWFCDPHAPWQRGQIKNQNRAWRWWFPRGTDPSTVTPPITPPRSSTGNDAETSTTNHPGYRSGRSLSGAIPTVTPLTIWSIDSSTATARTSCG